MLHDFWRWILSLFGIKPEVDQAINNAPTGEFMSGYIPDAVDNRDQEFTIGEK